MGEDPSVIRAEIERTRERVGDEVDALSYKTDVGARVGDYVDEKKQAITGAASKVVPSRQQVGRARDAAERNPLGLAVGGVAVGFVAGLLIPSTRVEDERMGEMSDRVLDAAKETAGEVAERGKEVAQQTAQSAVETAKETGREQSEELASNLQERAQETSASPSHASP